ncbi:MAG TPA: hypothetical protein VH231_04645 [Solirubrobacteraceae bacterium]|jgi:hypothetical protein|nr:hypothetical protein [Solirubrobacteraceae bacterium]
MLTRLSSSTVLAALILAAVVPVALASRPASGSQSRAITEAVVGCGITPNAVLQDCTG